MIATRTLAGFHFGQALADAALFLSSRIKRPPNSPRCCYSLVLFPPVCIMGLTLSVHTLIEEEN